MTSQLIHRYSPTSLEEVTFPDPLLQAQIKAHAMGLMNGHLILHGDNGSGKSSMAKFIFEGLGGADFDAIGGADLIDNFEPTLKMLESWRCFSRHTACGRFFLHIEELQADHSGMSKFWRWLDSLDPSAKVIITSNKLMAINKSIRSRMSVMHVPGLSPDQFMPIAQKILLAEGSADVPDWWLLQQLQKVASPPDNRKYYGEVEKIIALLKVGFSIPSMPPPPVPTKPKLKVVKTK